MKNLILMLALVLAMFVFSGTSYATGCNSGSAVFTGYVTDSSNNFVGGAKMTIFSSDTHTRCFTSFLTARTGANIGEYTSPFGLEAGNYYYLKTAVDPCLPLIGDERLVWVPLNATTVNDWIVLPPSSGC